MSFASTIISYRAASSYGQRSPLEPDVDLINKLNHIFMKGFITLQFQGFQTTWNLEYRRLLDR